MRSASIFAQAERLLWCIAIGCGAWSGIAWQQAHATARVAATLASAPSARVTATTLDSGVIGELRIPALQLSVPVVEGTDDGDLRRGVGHIPGTAMPGGLGTTAIAGHRDTFLRSIRRLQLHTMVELSRGSQTYRYQVDSTEIVKPETVRVLETGSVPELVIVTCYPFQYIGHAPFRYIVHAHLVSLVPSQTE